MISRVPSSKDRRRLDIILSPRGQRALAAIEAEDREICVNLLKALSEPERGALLESLDKMSTRTIKARKNTHELKPKKVPKRGFLKSQSKTKTKASHSPKPQTNAMKTEYSFPKKR